MKYINTFEKFDLNKEKPVQPLEIMADMQNFNKSEQDFKEFQGSRKNDILNIYLNYVEDPSVTGTGISKDLFNKLRAKKFLKKEATPQKLLWENPFFRLYAEYCATQRKIKKGEETLNLKKQDILQRQQALQNNQGDKTDINKDIQTSQNDIADKLKQIETERQEIEKMKVDSKNELDLMKRELENSKKRINTLKNPS
jgi:hypothetical protein